jgi:hypothetical protein
MHSVCLARADIYSTDRRSLLHQTGFRLVATLLPVLLLLLLLRRRAEQILDLAHAAEVEPCAYENDREIKEIEDPHDAWNNKSARGYND